MTPQERILEFLSHHPGPWRVDYWRDAQGEPCWRVIDRDGGAVISTVRGSFAQHFCEWLVAARSYERSDAADRERLLLDKCNAQIDQMSADWRESEERLRDHFRGELETYRRALEDRDRQIEDLKRGAR